MLRRRSELLKQIRQFFDQRGFFEVQTPLLSRDTVVDRYIDPIPVSATAIGLSDASDEFWLQTSPEFCMKRVLAAGADAIYQIAHAFRAGEAGRRHNPEFNMLEWYRTGDDQQKGIQLLGEFACEIFETDDFDVVSYQDLFLQNVGVDGLADETHPFSQAAISAGVDTSSFEAVDDVDAWRNLLLTEIIEPKLGSERPVIVYDWPASQAALAKCRSSNPPVAERFELYFRGTELANGYHELLDAEELLARNERVNRQREKDGKTPLPSHSRLVQAMRAGINSCSGVAVGIDRLLMVLCDVDHISEITAFTIDNA